jgi:hypothetical protein
MERYCRCLIGLVAISLLFLASSAHSTGYKFKTLNVPGASSTQAWGINNAGQIVGSYDDGTGSHGFLFFLPHPSPSIMLLLE